MSWNSRITAVVFSEDRQNRRELFFCGESFFLWRRRGEGGAEILLFYGDAERRIGRPGRSAKHGADRGAVGGGWVICGAAERRNAVRWSGGGGSKTRCVVHGAARSFSGFGAEESGARLRSGRVARRVKRVGPALLESGVGEESGVGKVRKRGVSDGRGRGSDGSGGSGGSRRRGGKHGGMCRAPGPVGHSPSPRGRGGSQGEIGDGERREGAGAAGAAV
jgi:hypothetical protein